MDRRITDDRGTRVRELELQKRRHERGARLADEKLRKLKQDTDS